MNVLITNRELVCGGGTEIVTRDLAFELKKMGHAPVVYSPVVGALADEIRAGGIAVFCSVGGIEPVPDVIHGQSHPQTLAALLRFPATPAIFVCHDASAWPGEPLIFPRVLRYVGVDDRCRQRIERNSRVPHESTRVILNAVDMNRFKPRAPLPEWPRQAAIFSNYATKWTHTGPITRACESLGIELDVIGKGADTAASEPEAVLPKYDLVFAKARCALEAMAIGSAVVLCDFSGLGAMVNSSQFTELRRLNFGAGTLLRPLDADLIAAEIKKYDADDACLVAERTRREASLSGAITDWVDLYQEVIADWKEREGSLSLSQVSTDDEEMAAVAEYIEAWGYGARIAWEKSQVEKLRRWPILGRWIEWAVKREHARRLRS